MSCYTDYDGPPWRCERPATYEVKVGWSSGTLMLCNDCLIEYRERWPGEIDWMRTATMSSRPTRANPHRLHL